MAFKFWIFEFGEDRYQPEKKDQRKLDREYTLNKNRLANLVGLVGIFLPLALWLGGTAAGCMRESVSHYYFAPFWGDVFVGGMFFIGTFLIAYRGDHAAENWFATAAGIGAFGTALFPINGSGCAESAFPTRAFIDVNNSVAPPVSPLMDNGFDGYFLMNSVAPALHSIFAVILTIFLAYYCFAVFTRVNPDTQLDSEGNLTPTKQKRNRFYRIAGWLIVFAVTAMLSHVLLKAIGLGGIPNWTEYRGSFIAETVAMMAFGFSWILKGRLFGWLLADDDSYEV